jgi:hypothetical protein
MEQPVEEFEHAGLTIKIYQDYDAEAPDRWENEDLFLITTRNREFDVQRDGFTVESVSAGEHKADYHHLPLIAYVHSGVGLSLSRERYPFNCPWDSGKIGFVLVKKRAGFRNIRKAAQSLVDEWNQYLSGDVYGYVIESDGEGHEDSCWGFYGLEYCKTEAKAAVHGVAVSIAKAEALVAC